MAPGKPAQNSQPVANRTLLQSYKALPASTRLRFSLAMCGVAITGIAISNWLEKRIPTEKAGEEVLEWCTALVNVGKTEDVGSI
ncbi:hypothetical protein PM082_003302 [Marasmius tenuissimus]|nr:hypothetical protein PM082_003302 [Marasmius tenuissimus]